MEFRAIAGLSLYIFHRRRVPEADGITDEDTAARQLRFSGGIGRHAPCCSAVLRDMEPAVEREAQAVAAERFDSAARTVAGLVGAQALHHGSGSTLGDGLVLSGPGHAEGPGTGVESVCGAGAAGAGERA